MLKIYAQFWTRAFDYSGRSDTTDFWVPFVFNCILVLILSILGALAFGNDISKPCCKMKCNKIDIFI